MAPTRRYRQSPTGLLLRRPAAQDPPPKEVPRAHSRPMPTPTRALPLGRRPVRWGVHQLAAGAARRWPSPQWHRQTAPRRPMNRTEAIEHLAWRIGLGARAPWVFTGGCPIHLAPSSSGSETACRRCCTRWRSSSHTPMTSASSSRARSRCDVGAGVAERGRSRARMARTAGDGTSRSRHPDFARFRRGALSTQRSSTSAASRKAAPERRDHRGHVLVRERIAASAACEEAPGDALPGATLTGHAELQGPFARTR